MTQLNLINLKNVFLYEIGLIAIREVSSPFDEEQQYWRPYQPKHSPSCQGSHFFICMWPRADCTKNPENWLISMNRNTFIKITEFCDNCAINFIPALTRFLQEAL